MDYLEKICMCGHCLRNSPLQHEDCTLGGRAWHFRSLRAKVEMQQDMNRRQKEKLMISYDYCKQILRNQLKEWKWRNQVIHLHTVQRTNPDVL